MTSPRVSRRGGDRSHQTAEVWRVALAENVTREEVANYLRQGDNEIIGVCLFICLLATLSVSNITQKVINGV